MATLEAPPRFSPKKRTPMAEAVLKKNRIRILGLTVDEWIHYYFSSNAAVSIIVLTLIMLMLFKEGFEFFPQNQRNLTVYREAGLEYVDYLRSQIDGFTILGRYLNQTRLHEFQSLQKQGKSPEEIQSILQPFDDFNSRFGDAITELNGMLSDQTELASALKDRVKIAADQAEEIIMLKGKGKFEEAAKIKPAIFDFRKETQPLRDQFPQYQEANRKLAKEMNTMLHDLPAAISPKMQAALQKFSIGVREQVAQFGAIEQKMQGWNPLTPISFFRTFTEFIFGPRWLTASFWQDWYGVVPLLVGSVMVSILALVIAVPLAILAAIYVNQVASVHERNFFKPYIEFISAIPSVVLGFFGIAVLGEGLRWISNITWLSWVPGFPMSERLTILTAGCLLALMAVPTIFSLAEDALNNVPQAYTEASLALGATKWQTITTIMIPTALSGIISAILLGFGRVIGETMVVLLCAGNRIQIPDFSAGLGAFVQPAHTMTGIIAQEMGEVVRGSIHYRALFMVGLVLFFISLLINYLAHLVVKRFKISAG